MGCTSEFRSPFVDGLQENGKVCAYGLAKSATKKTLTIIVATRCLTQETCFCKQIIGHRAPTIMILRRDNTVKVVEADIRDHHLMAPSGNPLEKGLRH